MGQLAIIADDLSSCTDCGIQIARDGLQTFVVLDQDQDFTLVEKYDVIALDTESRAASPKEAYKRVKRAARLVRGHFGSIYKSLDSTLRGNLGVEIDAVMDVIDFDLAIVAPAFPFYGRTTLGGVHYLHGKRINETEFSSDPQSPVRESDLVKLLSSQSRRKVGHLELSVLHQGSTAVSKRLGELVLDEAELVIFDVQVEADLGEIVLSVEATNYRVLWVGSTGMAGHISRMLTMHPDRSLNWQNPEYLSKPTIVVAGSASEITRDQLNYYKRQSNAYSVQMNPLKIIQGTIAQKQEIDRCRALLMSGLGKGKDMILEVASSRADIEATQALGQRMGKNISQISITIVESLAEIVSATVERFQVSGLILTGGDTAKAVCYRLGAKGILILKEIEPGIPLARLIGRHEVDIVTKAGGFGKSTTLLHVNSMLKGE